MGDEMTHREKVGEAFLEENPFADEANTLLAEAIDKRSEHVLRRAETFATLAIAFETRELRFGLREGLHDHANRVGGG